MQAYFVQEGASLDYTPDAETLAGTVVVQNSLVGIVNNDIEANRLGAISVEGVFDVSKVTGSINAGAAIYWDDDANPVDGEAGSGAATSTSEGNTFMGFATQDAGANDAKVRLTLVKPASVSNTIHNFLTGVIADPGNAGAIPVTGSGSCQLVTAGAETRTLANPTTVGQTLALSMKTDGGDCVVTAAAGVNQTGNTVLTFNDAGDVIVLVGIESGANKRWRVLSNDGVTLSTP